MYQKIFQQAGLSEAEASVYNAIILLGQATPAEIAKKAAIGRENTYHVLKRLSNLGLVSQIAKEKKQAFVAESPEVLLRTCEEQEREVKQTKKVLEDLIEDIESIIRLKQRKPVVKYFEGLEGVKRVLNDTLTVSKGSKQYGAIERSWDPSFKEWIDKVLIKKRAAKDIFLKAICVDSKATRELEVRDKEEERESVLLSSSRFRFPKGTYLNIYGNKVMFVTKRFKGTEKIGIIIDHEIIAKAMKALFDLAWKAVKRNEKLQT